MSRYVPSALTDALEACTDSPLVDLARSIDNSARALRFNKDDAGRLARYVQDLVTALDSIQQERNVAGDNGTENELPFEGEMQRVLSDTQAGLEALTRRSYVGQVVFQQRDKETLIGMWDNLHDAFDVLKIQLSLKLSETIMALEQRSPLVADLDCQIQPAASTPALHPPVPPLPQLFGRAAELEAVVAAVAASTLGHVAILGGPGMGKTSLALAAMHHPRVLGRFEQRRYFVACDAAEYNADCVSVVAGAFGYSGQNHAVLKEELLRALAGPGAPTLLVLDNFESAWEAAESRANAEQLLRAIAGLGNVALVVTLRGAERPQGVPWTRPFLAPLCPLPDDAAKQTFIAISDVPDSSESTAMLVKILSYLENVPLALVLMANQAQYETLATLLGRWHDMKTAMLTRGDGKQRLNALDVSIATSLDSPRMRQRPEAKRLLGLLSLLPVGAMHTDLAIWGPTDYQQSVSVLLQTAVVYKTPDQRLRVLAPIREFMLANYAPTDAESAQIYKYFFSLPRLCIDSEALASISTSLAAILPELDNLEFLILYSLRHAADKIDALKAAVNLGVLYSNGGMRSLHDLLPFAISVSRDGGFDSFTGDLLTLCATGMANTNMRLGDPLRLLTEARAMYERIGAPPWRGLEASMIMMRYLTPVAAIAEARRVIEVAKEHGYRDTEARYKRALAAAYERVGRVADALVCQEEALAILREIQPGPDNIMADSMVQVAVFHGEAGSVTQSIAELREAQTVCEYLQDARCLAWIHLALGQTFVHRGLYPLAIVELRKSLGFCRKNQNKLEFFCLSDLLIAHLARDDATAALDLVHEAELMVGNYGPTAVRVRSYVAWMHGELALYRNQIDEARAALMVSRSICHAGNDPTDTAEGLLLHEAKICIVAGRIEQTDGRLDDAANNFILAAVVRAKFRICTDTICALARLAEVVDDVSSAALLGATMVALHRFGYHPQLASSLVQSARLAERLGQLRLARHRADNALHYFEETGDRRGSAGARALMARVEFVTTSNISK